MCGELATVYPIAGCFRFSAMNGHHQTGPHGPVGANSGHSLVSLF
jgi:hypothetical protein